MNDIAEGRDIVLGVDPAGNWHLPAAWAADEAHRRGLALHAVLALPERHDRHHAYGAQHHHAREQAARETLRGVTAWLADRQPEVRVTTALLRGFPSAVLTGLSRGADMVVLGSRKLNRAEEFLSAGSLVVPVTAQAHCPVVVVGDTEHVIQEPPYLVVGIDGGGSSRAALDLAFEEADLRGCQLHAVAVWQPPVFFPHGDDEPVQDVRRSLAESTAGWRENHPDVDLTHEVRVGSPVEELADVAEHALAVVVGRRGTGGYTGMRLGSLVHGLLHRAHCPVITVPAA